MKSTIAAIVLLGLAAAAMSQDEPGTRAADAALERERAQAAARDKASQEARARQQQEIEAGARATMASDYRKSLGVAAEGKSDDEVIRLYREKEAASGAAR